MKYIKEMGELSGTCSFDLESGMFARNLLFFLCQLILKTQCFSCILLKRELQTAFWMAVAILALGSDD